MHAPADEGKGQFKRGCAEIDGELYSIVGDSVCAIRRADSACANIVECVFAAVAI